MKGKAAFDKLLLLPIYCWYSATFLLMVLVLYSWFVVILKPLNNATERCLKQIMVIENDEINQCLVTQTLADTRITLARIEEEILELHTRWSSSGGLIRACSACSEQSGCPISYHELGMKNKDWHIKKKARIEASGNCDQLEQFVQLLPTIDQTVRYKRIALQQGSDQNNYSLTCELKFLMPLCSNTKT